jgi:hypothetical protein
MDEEVVCTILVYVCHFQSRRAATDLCFSSQYGCAQPSDHGVRCFQFLSVVYSTLCGSVFRPTSVVCSSTSCSSAYLAHIGQISLTTYQSLLVSPPELYVQVSVRDVELANLLLASCIFPLLASPACIVLLQTPPAAMVVDL